MKECNVLKHEMTLSYECSTKKETFTITLVNPHIGKGQYYEDWHYTYVEFRCPYCGMSHMFEI